MLSLNLNQFEKLLMIGEISITQFLPDVFSRINGILLKKAEDEGNFSIYSQTFQKLNELEVLEEDLNNYENEIFKLLGDLGG